MLGLSFLASVFPLLGPSLLLGLSSELFGLIVQIGLNISVLDEDVLRFLQVNQYVLGYSEVVVQRKVGVVPVFQESLVAFGEVAVASQCFLLIFNLEQDPDLVAAALHILH